MARSKFAGDKKMSEDNIENQEPIPVKLILERILSTFAVKFTSFATTPFAPAMEIA